MNELGAERLPARLARWAKHVGTWQWALLGLAFLTFFAAFRLGWHFQLIDRVLHVNSYSFWVAFQQDSDALVIDRFRQNHLGGLFSEGLRLGVSGEYISQVGFGGWLLTLVPTILGLPEPMALSLMFTIVAVFNAAMATAGVWLLGRTLSIGSGLVAALALLQPWSVAMGKSIYWMIGLKLLGAALLIAIHNRRRDTPRLVLMASLIGSLLAFLSGYEYLTVVAATQLAVVGYYAIVRKYSLRTALLRFATAFGGIVTGFAVALAIHVGLLYLKFGGWAATLQALEYTVAKRTGVTHMDVDPIFAQSLAASPAMVLQTYLSMPVIGAPYGGLLLSYFSVATLLVVCGFAILSVWRHQQPTELEHREQALGMAWLISLLGPLGWFLLARPHSFIHVHINYALWFLPVIPLALALLWSPIQHGALALRRRPVAGLIPVVFAIAVLVFYLYSAATVR